MKHIIVVSIWFGFSLSCFAFNWGNTVNEGSIIIDNNVISGSSSSTGIRGSGKQITQQRTLEAFNKLAIDIVADVRVTLGTKYHLSIKADDNIIEIISTDVADKQLIISSRKNYSARKPAIINIEVPMLKEVKQLGMGNIILDNISKETLTIIIAGSGSVSAKGTVGSLRAETSGTGSLNLQQLIAKRVSIKITGMGDAKIHALDALDVVIDGMGNVLYSGNPKNINKSITGMGDIIPR